MRLLIKSDCDLALVGLCGAWETQGFGSLKGICGEDSDNNLISSFERTASGSNGIIPAPFKLLRTLTWVIILTKECLKASKNSILVI